MAAEILSGKIMSESLRKEIAERVSALKERGVTPGLAVILVGNDPASEIYVRNKGNGCAEVGMYSRTINMPEETTQEQLEAAIEELNSDSAIHGILVQLPLPKHLDENAALAKILPEKDVDGFHLINAGHMLTAPAAAELYRNHVPQPHEEPGGAYPPGGCAGGRGGQSRLCDSGYGEARCHRHRRGHQPGGR